MNRQIKFRALYRGTWYYQTLEEMLTITLAAFRLGKHKTQFIGLLDKNGKEIYEGDRTETNEGLVGTIVFENGCFVWTDGAGKWDIIYKHLDFTQRKQVKDLRIIGNIYENPELLK